MELPEREGRHAHVLRLACGSLRCDLAAHLGGAIAGLWAGEHAVLRSTSGAQLGHVQDAGCYPLVPFSNRVGDAALTWNGNSHRLVRNLYPEPHAIHGVGWERPWKILQAGATHALLAYSHRPDAGWPFAFDSSQAFRLDRAALEVTLVVTNRSDQAAPMGLGWHPFFVKRPGSRISFAANGLWEMGVDKLPTHRLPSGGLDADCAALAIDHCFDGWRGVLHLRDAVMDVQLRSSLEHLVVYTHGGCDFVAIEPVSHVNNAVNMLGAARYTAQQLGVRTLQPGESMSASMRIEIGSTP